MDDKEIVYRGITFRNRLEAQWALFFDTLGITYRYETKPHTHEGITILPSFYLPQYPCFIIVKEQFLSSKEVSEEEEEILEEIKLLTLYEGKATYTLVGNVWLPGEPDSYESYNCHPPIIYTHPADGWLGGDQTEEVQASIMVKLILHKLRDWSMTAVSHHRQLSLYSTRDISLSNIEGSMKSYLEYMVYQHECLTDIAPLIVEHYHDLVTVLTPKSGMVIEYMEIDIEEMSYVWAECSECGDIKLMFYSSHEDHILHRECQGSKKGLYKVNSARLLNAYSIARKGDFEEFF